MAKYSTNACDTPMSVTNLNIFSLNKCFYKERKN